MEKKEKKRLEDALMECFLLYFSSTISNIKRKQLKNRKLKFDGVKRKEEKSYA